VQRNEIFLGSRSDGERVPFLFGDVGTIEEEVLSGLVDEGALLQLQLKHARRMGDRAQQNGVLIAPQNPHRTFDDVEQARTRTPNVEGWGFEQTGSTVEHHKGIENDEEVMGIPEDVEVGTSNTLHGCGVEHYHANTHNVTSGPSNRGVGQLVDGGSGGVGGVEGVVQGVDVTGEGGDEVVVEVVSTNVSKCENPNGPGDVSVEDDVLVDGDEVA